MYSPVNPSFTIRKWGLMGSKVYRHVFVMENGPIFMLGAKTITVLAKQPCHSQTKMHR